MQASFDQEVILHEPTTEGAVTDEATWEGLSATIWVRESGEVMIGGDWLTAFGIADAEQLAVSTAAWLFPARSLSALLK